MKKELNQIYIVQENDNIEKIAKKYKINPINILISNKISPKMIKKGVILYINNKN